MALDPRQQELLDAAQRAWRAYLAHRPSGREAYPRDLREALVVALDTGVSLRTIARHVGITRPRLHTVALEAGMRVRRGVARRVLWAGATRPAEDTRCP